MESTIFEQLRKETLGALGHFRIATTVGLIATQAADGTLFSFRWTDTGRLCYPVFIRLSAMQTAAATATIMPRFQVFTARGFTASDSGGVAVNVASNNTKKRTSMLSSLVADVRKSNAAAGLTAGTRTLDADPILELPTNQTITTPNPNLYSQALDLTQRVEHPLVLAANEGLIVRGPTTVFGAAGTMDLAVELAWAELPTS